MRMTRRIPIVAAILATTAALILPGVASAASARTCRSTIKGGWVFSDVRVPNKATCTLNGVHVTGSVSVGSGASLITTNGTNIARDLSADMAKFIEVNNTSVYGNVFVSKLRTGGEAKNVICADTIRGSLIVADSDSASTVIVGDLPADETCRGANSIGGYVKIFGNHSNTQFANNTVSGSVWFADNTQTTAEEVEYDVGGNHIDGALFCSGNNPSPEIREANTAAGGLYGQCAP